jgi:hypothetical protein
MRALTLVLLLLTGSAAVLEAQSFTPQSASGLSVSHSVEKAGGSRVLIFGEVRNATNSTAERVAIVAEGLDETGRVVSRGRAFVAGTVSARGNAPFEVRLLASGSERRYRVQVESFQFQNLQGN